MAAVTGEANMAAAVEAKKKGAEAVAGAGAKRKKMVRVKQVYIDGILEVYSFTPFPCDPEEIDKTISDPETSELLRSMTASVSATIKAWRAKDEAIIKQYYAKGYAEEEIEVSDDDEEEA